MNIEYVRNGAVIEDGSNVYSFQVMDNPREFDSLRINASSLDWNDQNYHLGKWKVFPYGNDNQLPTQIRYIIQTNYISPGLMKKKTQWLWGKGPKLYEEVYEGRELIRNWQENEEIQAWLDSWDFETYAQAVCVDFNYMEGVWTKFVQSRGGRVGKPKIAKLEHVKPDRARLAGLMSSMDPKPTHGIVTDWNFEMINAILNPKIYPLFDFKNPFKSKHSIYYSNMYSFCSDYYTVPDIYGSLEWIRRSTSIPILLAAMAKNSANVKYHVISPQQFWDDKKDMLEKIAEKKGVPYKDADLVAYKSKLLKEVVKVLSSDENAGKIWHTTKSFDVEGTNLLEHGWEIKELPNNIKNFIDAQISVSKHAAHAVSGGSGLGSILGNVSEEGSRNSGSDRIYAIKEYLETGIDIPEMLTLKAVNFAIKANWPKSKLKVGYYHTIPKKEEEEKPDERIKNN
jgi:hypothetical protein